MILTKGLYSEIDSRNNAKRRDPARQHEADELGPFGLVHWQTFSKTRLLAEAGWANVNAELIGRGDLTIQNLIDIMHDIPGGEAFLVLYKNDVPHESQATPERVLSVVALVITSQGAWIINQSSTMIGGSFSAQSLRREDLKEFLETVKRQRP